MRGKFFWILLTLLIIIATHIGYILYMPVMVMSDKFTQQAKMTSTPKPAIWSTANDSNFFTGADPFLMIAVCQFSLKDGRSQMNFALPDNYWSISAYTTAGNSFYSINDRQADTNEIKLDIIPVDTVDETIVTDVSSPTARLVVKSPDNRGLIVVRTRINEFSARKRLIGQLEKSSCSTGQDKK